jgi:polyketide cyclase/dehydrase/lipid transport protein
MAEKTSSSVTIAASRAEIMAVIADFPAYPQWASAVRETEVVASDPEGRPSRVRFRLDAGMVRDTYVLGYQWDGVAGVHWHLAEPGTVISAMDGSYLLGERDGGTEVTYELTVDVRIPMLGMLKRKAEKVIIDTALMGLKRRAEAGRGDGG